MLVGNQRSLDCSITFLKSTIIPVGQQKKKNTDPTLSEFPAQKPLFKLGKF